MDGHGSRPRHPTARAGGRLGGSSRQRLLPGPVGGARRPHALGSRRLSFGEAAAASRRAAGRRPRAPARDGAFRHGECATPDRPVCGRGGCRVADTPRIRPPRHAIVCAPERRWRGQLADGFCRAIHKQQLERGKHHGARRRHPRPLLPDTVGKRERTRVPPLLAEQRRRRELGVALTGRKLRRARPHLPGFDPCRPGAWRAHIRPRLSAGARADELAPRRRGGRRARAAGVVYPPRPFRRS
mmetsp:Transcript_25678/g.60297  ORF Transcript_25678/g.60297 Transcript_25678/m.60297 type:complete len:242 (-) Transcript_25678:355-1080(-)